MIQSDLLTSSDSRAMPEIGYEDVSLPGFLDDWYSDDNSIPGSKVDSASDDDTDVSIRHVRRRIPWRLKSYVSRCRHSWFSYSHSSNSHCQHRPFTRFIIRQYTDNTRVHVAKRASAARIVDDNISSPSVFRSLQPLGTYATATQS